MIDVCDLRHAAADVVGSWLTEISDNLRQSDVEEVRASSALPPREALASSVALSSHAYVVLSTHPERRGPIAAFGAAPHPLPGVGVVWMLGTGGIRRVGYSVAKQTRPYLDQLNAVYPILWNFIDARNAVSLRWLRWGGFKLLAPHPNHGPEGRLFYTFVRTTFDV